MKQKLSLLINLLLFAAVIQAAPVSKTEAQKKAQQFISGKIAAARGTSTPDLQLATTDGDNYYVFNVSGQQGFVIVSGDDRAPEILGYSDEGQFDAANIPSNMKAWLQGYADEIQELKNMPEVAGARSAARVPERNWAAIDPLIQTKWDQDAPYNLKTPIFLNNAQCVTGCVATAMAQVLYYVASKNGFTFPVETSVEIPAYQCERNWGSHVQVPAVPKTTFKWNQMKLTYSNTETNDAVAELMLCCGASVNMDYADQVNGGSQASSTRIPNAFRTYFGFDGSVRHIQRIYYTIDEWEEIIYNEIANNRPVLYGGQSTGGGHEFVCDGYDGNGLFHFNWGWSGNHNGFFVLWTANPNGSGIGGSDSYDGYSMSQDAVIGIQKPTGSSTIEELKRLSVKDIKVKNNLYTYTRTSKNSDFTVPICAVVGNATGSTFNVHLGLGLYNNNNLSEFLKIDGTYSYTNGGSSTPGGFYGTDNGEYVYTNYTFGANKTGTYRIVPISKEYESSTWLEDGLSDIYYIEATLADNQLDLVVKPIVNLEVTNVEYTGNKMANIVQEVKVSIQNNGPEYNGNLYFLVGDKVSGEGVALRAGETTDVYFHYVPESGTNNYIVSLSDDGTNPLEEGQIEIVPFDATDNIDLDIELTIHNKIIDNYIIGNKLVATIIATNNSKQVYSGEQIGLYYRKYYSQGYSQGRKWAEDVIIMPGESYAINLTYDLNYGSEYFFSGYQFKNNEVTLQGDNYTYTAAEGLEVTLADGTSDMVVAEPTYVPTPSTTAVDLRGVTTVNSVATEFADPNCLFVIDEDADIEGLGLENTNVIKGTSAENIQLTDESIGFTAPINFTAKEISYKRTFTQGTDGTGSGWTTIILPFDVQKVMVGENEIDWFHDSNETGKQFWLRELKSDDEGSVTFGYVSKLKANTPYIIAVPSDKWGEKWDLTNKTLTFIGANADIAKDADAETDGEHYSFVGTTIRQELKDVYALNDVGSTFVHGNATIAPFRAYFTPLGGSNPSRLIIRSEDGKTTAIGQLPAEIATPDGIYTLDGRKVKGNLKKGVYIVNGKKMIK